MHELLRQFANEKLASDPQAEAVTRERHSAYYLGFLKAREAMLTGQGQRQALAEIGQEIENIGIAWRWAVEQGYLAAIDQAVEVSTTSIKLLAVIRKGKKALPMPLRNWKPPSCWLSIQNLNLCSIGSTLEVEAFTISSEIMKPPTNILKAA